MASGKGTLRGILEIDSAYKFEKNGSVEWHGVMTVGSSDIAREVGVEKDQRAYHILSPSINVVRFELAQNCFS